MNLSDEQLQILQQISTQQPVSQQALDWAIQQELATQAEDGDVDLTQRARDLFGDRLL